MAELPPPRIDSEQRPLPNRAMVGRWNTDQYLQVLRWPMIVFAVLTIGLILFEQPQLEVLFEEMLGAVWLGWAVKQGRGRRTESLTAGAVLGLVMGLSASIARYIVQPSIIAIIGGVSETLLTGLVISLLTTSVTILFFLRSTSTH